MSKYDRAGDPIEDSPPLAAPYHAEARRLPAFTSLHRQGTSEERRRIIREGMAEGARQQRGIWERELADAIADGREEDAAAIRKALAYCQ